MGDRAMYLETLALDCEPNFELLRLLEPFAVREASKY
jgi:hypothetical protein